MPATSSPVVSAALAEANRLLLERRAALKAARERDASPPFDPDPPAVAPGRAWKAPAARYGAACNPASPPERSQQAARREAHPEPIPDSHIRLYPDIVLGMLRHELEAAGRIWLLLRHIDRAGQGWVDIDEARRHLATKGSRLCVCGWRQLRNLLRQGQGVFWERDSKRIWLRGTVRVAASLGVERLSGRPVALPVEALCGGIGDVRAHFYTSFHSGRADGEAMPIARATLATVTSVPPRTQRAYEQRAGASARENYAIGEEKTEDTQQERAWRHGRATFVLKDRQGFHGEKGLEYVAWQLPNSYTGPHEQRPRGRQRHLNRKLADLRDKGDAGNGQGDEQRDPCQGGNQEFRQAQHKPVVRRYFENGGAAAKAFNRDPRLERYWKGRLSGNGKKLWYEMAGQAE